MLLIKIVGCITLNGVLLPVLFIEIPVVDVPVVADKSTLSAADS